MGCLKCGSQPGHIEPGGRTCRLAFPWGAPCHQSYCSWDEVFDHGAKAGGTGIELLPGKEWPLIRAFMDDLALSNTARELAAAILRRLEEYMD